MSSADHLRQWELTGWRQPPWWICRRICAALPWQQCCDCTPSMIGGSGAIIRRLAACDSSSSPRWHHHLHLPDVQEIPCTSSWAFLKICVFLFVTGFRQEEVLRPLHVSVPVGPPSHGARSSLHHQWHLGTLPEDERPPGVCFMCVCACVCKIHYFSSESWRGSISSISSDALNPH